jgi:hypothetical protein
MYVHVVAVLDVVLDCREATVNEIGRLCGKVRMQKRVVVVKSEYIQLDLVFRWLITRKTHVKIQGFGLFFSFVSLVDNVVRQVARARAVVVVLLLLLLVVFVAFFWIA